MRDWSSRCYVTNTFVYLLYLFFSDTATTDIYTLSYTTLFRSMPSSRPTAESSIRPSLQWPSLRLGKSAHRFAPSRSEEHTSELQSHHDLVCRLLLEKKNYYLPLFDQPHHFVWYHLSDPYKYYH